MSVETEVSALSGASEADLLKSIGEDLLGKQGLPMDPAELIERGSRWVRAQSAALQGTVCANAGLRNFVQSKDSTDINSIAVEIAKLLLGLVLPVNPVALAVLFAKRGVKSICEVKWRELDESEPVR